MDQARDRIQRVEEEMRIDLGSECLQLGAACMQRELLRDVLLLELTFLEMKVFEHVREHVSERLEQVDVLAEVGCVTRPRAHHESADHVLAGANRNLAE